MTKIKIEQLIWDEWNIEHIKKHDVTVVETEVALKHVGAHRYGYIRRIMLIGRSGKRILSIVLSREKQDKYYIVTVRDSDKRERRLLYANEKKEIT